MGLEDETMNPEQRADAIFNNEVLGRLDRMTSSFTDCNNETDPESRSPDCPSLDEDLEEESEDEDKDEDKDEDEGEDEDEDEDEDESSGSEVEGGDVAAPAALD